MIYKFCVFHVLVLFTATLFFFTDLSVVVTAQQQTEETSRRTTRKAAAHRRVRTRKSYKCAKGCPLKVAKVCGRDGVTYQNECIAFCQGKAIHYKGFCVDSPDAASGSSSPSGVDDTTLDQVGLVTYAQLTRYASEGFSFMVRRKFVKTNPFIPGPEPGETAAGHQPLHHTQQVQDKEDAKEDSDDPSNRHLNGRLKKLKTRSTPTTSPVRTIRITDDGCEYFGSFWPSSSPPRFLAVERGVSSSYATSVVSGDKHDHDGAKSRNLKVLDADSRAQVINPDKTFPEVLVGEIGVNGDSGGCTGTIIGENNIVTAAHCFGTPTNGLNQLGNFAPARYRLPSGTVVDPFGTFQLEYVEIHLQYRYCGSDCGDWDVVILKTKPRIGSNGEQISVLGAVGRGNLTKLQETSPQDAKDLGDVVIRGYPEDKSDGSMWSAGNCKWTKNSYAQTIPGKTVQMKHFCDTEGGMSGSTLMTADGTIRAIHTGAAGQGQEYNTAVCLDGDILSLLQKYLGK